MMTRCFISVNSGVSVLFCLVLAVVITVHVRARAASQSVFMFVNRKTTDNVTPNHKRSSNRIHTTDTHNQPGKQSCYG